MQEIAIRLNEERRLEFRRILKRSLVLHLAFFGFLAWSPSFQASSLPAAVTVQLVSLPSSALAAPRARPKPRPKPPKPAPVILPTEPSTPQPKTKPEPKEKPPEEPKEVEYEDLMAQLRADAGEPDSKPPPDEEPVQTASIGGAGGAGMLVPPELAAWMRDARIHVRRSWVVPPAFEMERLVVEVKIELYAAGNVKGTPRVARRSGNPWYDDNVIRSVQKASPLPAPPEAGSWTFVFYSDRDA